LRKSVGSAQIPLLLSPTFIRGRAILSLSLPSLAAVFPINMVEVDPPTDGTEGKKGIRPPLNREREGKRGGEDEEGHLARVYWRRISSLAKEQEEERHKTPPVKIMRGHFLLSCNLDAFVFDLQKSRLGFPPRPFSLCPAPSLRHGYDLPRVFHTRGEGGRGATSDGAFVFPRTGADVGLGCGTAASPAASASVGEFLCVRIPG